MSTKRSISRVILAVVLGIVFIFASITICFSMYVHHNIDEFSKKDSFETEYNYITTDRVEYYYLDDEASLPDEIRKDISHIQYPKLVNPDVLISQILKRGEATMHANTSIQTIEKTDLSTVLAKYHVYFPYQNTTVYKIDDKKIIFGDQLSKIKKIDYTDKENIERNIKNLKLSSIFSSKKDVRSVYGFQDEVGDKKLDDKSINVRTLDLSVSDALEDVHSQLQSKLNINFIVDTEYVPRDSFDRDEMFEELSEKIDAVTPENKDNTIILVSGSYCESAYSIVVGKNLKGIFTDDVCNRIVHDGMIVLENVDIPCSFNDVEIHDENALSGSALYTTNLIIDQLQKQNPNVKLDKIIDNYCKAEYNVEKRYDGSIGKNAVVFGIDFILFSIFTLL